VVIDRIIDRVAGLLAAGQRTVLRFHFGAIQLSVIQNVQFDTGVHSTFLSNE